LQNCSGQSFWITTAAKVVYAHPDYQNILKRAALSPWLLHPKIKENPHAIS